MFANSGKKKNKRDRTNRKSSCTDHDMAYVATGRYDGKFQKNLNLWDIASGIVLIKEAGGIINELNLDKLNNLKVIVSNPNINVKFQEKILNF